MPASSPKDLDLLRGRPYHWRDLAAVTLRHRREIVLANIIAVLGALLSIPIPLLIPMLVDDVLY
jgi:ATP-binding cassette subfamily C protein